MPSHPIGECFAERQLVLRASNGTEIPACVRIGRPVPTGDDWICPYEVELGTKKLAFAVYGVDSLQALALALKILDIELETEAKHADAVFLWLGEPHSTILDSVDRKRAK